MTAPISCRHCCACGGLSGTQLFDEVWPVVGIGTARIGIRICSDCGFVLQDPVIQPELLGRYYTQTSNYTNPGRSGRPSKTKISAVDRQLRMLHRFTPGRGSAMQIGCSDGYTLHRLREDGWKVKGVDPSPEASRLAADMWNVHVEIGFFEEWAENVRERFDLIVLTHILEHLYDPVRVLTKSRELLRKGGQILIEVPVLEEPDSWPPGYFTLEHLNYFACDTLILCLSQAGLSLGLAEPVIVTESVEYPILTCIARPGPEKVANWDSGKLRAQKALATVAAYYEREKSLWNQLDSRLRDATSYVEHAVIWGAGIHTSQLLARTELEKHIKIDYLVDSDKSKWGLHLGPYEIKDPEEIDYTDSVLGIVVSSFDSEREILHSLKDRSPGASVIPLYNSI